MSRRTVLDGAIERIVNFDDPPPVAETWWALATGRILDEETDVPIVGTVTTSAGARGVTTQATPDGAFALIGRPWLVCPPLNAPSYTLTATLAADGYIATDVDVTLPSAHRHVAAPAPIVGSPLLTLDSVANLVAGQILAIGPVGGAERARIRHLGPGAFDVTLDGGLRLPHAVGDVVVADSWTPVDLGAIPLRRETTVLRGRAARHDPVTNTVTPVPGATIAVADFWLTLADVHAQLPGRMTDPNPLTRMFVASIAPGVTRARAVGPGQVTERTLQGPAIPDDRLLAAAATARTTALRISDRSGLAPTSVVLVDPDRADVAEIVTIAAVTGWAPPDGPGDLQLALPLRESHPAGSRVIPLTVGAALPPANLRRDLRSGDRVVFVNDLTNLPDGATVEITDFAPLKEFQRLRLFQASSDADGYFALPPIHRVAMLAIVATAPMLAPVPFTVRPDYTAPEHLVDVVFA